MLPPPGSGTIRGNPRLVTETEGPPAHQKVRSSTSKGTLRKLDKDDLKELGLAMGPRKEILTALGKK